MPHSAQLQSYHRHHAAASHPFHNFAPFSSDVTQAWATRRPCHWPLPAKVEGLRDIDAMMMLQGTRRRHVIAMNA